MKIESCPIPGVGFKILESIQQCTSRELIALFGSMPRLDPHMLCISSPCATFALPAYLVGSTIGHIAEAGQRPEGARQSWRSTPAELGLAGSLVQEHASLGMRILSMAAEQGSNVLL
jgi:hypothetical protein